VLYLATDGECLNVVAVGEAHWQRLNKTLENLEQCPHPILTETKRQLTEYFSQQRERFDLPLDWHLSLYTSDAADERSSVDLGGRRIIKKKRQEDQQRPTTDTRHRHNRTQPNQTRRSTEDN